MSFKVFAQSCSTIAKAKVAAGAGVVAGTTTEVSHKLSTRFDNLTDRVAAKAATLKEEEVS